MALQQRGLAPISLLQGVGIDHLLDRGAAALATGATQPHPGDQKPPERSAPAPATPAPPLPTRDRARPPFHVAP